MMMAFAFWISLGPDAGLYTALYHTLPAFSFLRAPARMGVMVTLGTQTGDRVAVLSGLGAGDRVVVDGVMLLLAN